MSFTVVADGLQLSHQRTVLVIGPESRCMTGEECGEESPVQG